MMKVADVLEDLRFGALLRKRCGVLDGVGTSLGSNSGGDEEEINKFFNEIDMQEKVMEGQYETVLSNLEQFSYGHDDEDGDYKRFLENIKLDRDGQAYSSEISTSFSTTVIVRYDEKGEGSSENVDILKDKVPENSGGFVAKRKIEMPKTVKKSADIGAEGCKNKVRDVPSEERKSLVNENVVNENGDGSLACKTAVIVRYDEKEEWSSENVDRLKDKFPEKSGGFGGKRNIKMPKTVKKSTDIGAEGCKNKVRDVPREERKSVVNENVVKETGDGSVACKSSGEPFNEMDCDMIDESWARYLDSLDKSVNNMELSYESDQTSIHSKNDEDSSDLEMLELDSIPSSHEGDYTPFVSSKCYQPLVYLFSLQLCMLLLFLFSSIYFPSILYVVHSFTILFLFYVHVAKKKSLVKRVGMAS